MTEMQPISAFVRKYGITRTAERADSNPSMDDSANMDHWRVRLRSRVLGRSMTVPFSMGYGHNGRQPALADVLDALASDSAGYDNAGSFEDWCDEYGYDTDSRKHERTYRAVGRQRDRLYRFLGVTAYSELLWQTERE